MVLLTNIKTIKTIRNAKFLAASFYIYLSLLSYVTPAIAHQVKIAEEVGATIHVEPNDNPRAGENSQTWFGLTRKGGKTIALEECDCQLAIYREPRKPGDSPVLKPVLKPLSAEKYKDIPGAEIVFPQVGVYGLALNGQARDGKSFKPFELNFKVTVAAGNNIKVQENSKEKVQENSQEISQEISQEKHKNAYVNNQYSQLPFWVFLLPVVGIGGFLLWRKTK
jgi:hypothetical protein